ncbi:HEPN domain-containing protein [Rubrivivax gelatinosus]|uniref:HEPN domain-containing protein n=1 Tax=Rubrivivax gelatinosus TaxID=28068 RepID=UPI002174FB4A|nr:HEPN domain-containing protein [Rubrivivax gelatinosus]
MLAALRSSSDDRLRQAYLLLQHLRRLDERDDATHEDLIKAQKGMLFVSMYAALEYTVVSAVSDFLAELQANAAAPSAYKSSLIPTLLNREFNAIIGASKKTVWSHKLNLVRRLAAPDLCSIDNDVFPAESTNISADHLASIWGQLCLPGAPLPPQATAWLINELKNHRNAIAHGRETASSIGGRFSVSQLEQRYAAVQATCAHIVMAFEEHLDQRSYFIA